MAKRRPPKSLKAKAEGVGSHAQPSSPLLEVSAKAEQLVAAGDHQGAIHVYKQWLEKPNVPGAWVGWFNLGVLLRNIGDVAGATAAYEKSIAANPENTHARINLGTTLELAGRTTEAMSQWRTALDQLDATPTAPAELLCAVLNNLGRRLEVEQQYTAAEEMLVRSLRLNPKQDAVLYHRIYLRQKQCAWPIYAPLPGITEDDQRRATSAVAMLSITDDPAIQLQTAKVQGPSKVPAHLKDGAVRLAPRQGYRHKRLRIGYLSSNFGMHAVSILTAELYELHDRSRVEIWGFCWSPEDNTEMRARVIRAMDHFVIIKDMNDEQAAQAIRAAEIDVLVDLQGLTAGCRPAIIAIRPAPIQVTYLGFPGTTGLPGIDYVLADRYLIPDEYAGYYTEKPLYLPECFQVNDRKRESAPPKARSEYGLPEDAFVFCAFNNNIKFTPEFFAAWMRILQRTPGSVLWTLADNDKAIENLGRCADEHGVARERLIFAPRVSVADYLGRYAAADLFLDLFPFNGGTTVADALWMGLPVVTLSGRSFASRMAGSLLNNIGLSELVTHQIADYENLAVALAQDRKRVQAYRQHILSRRLDSAVFDTPRTVKAIEDAFFSVALVAGPESAAAMPPSPLPGALPVLPMPQQWQAPTTTPANLLVDGWRGIAHSYALVNQYQLYHWSRDPGLSLYHRDAPLLLERWKDGKQKSGLPPAYDRQLATIPAWQGEDYAARFRIFAPFDLSPDPKGRPTATFMVTEMGLGQDEIRRLQTHIPSYHATGGIVVTPSRWSAARIGDAGVPREDIFVVPHGVSPDIFYPMPPQHRLALRAQLGFGEEDVIFLNVGGGFWNKGLDILVRAFARVRSRHRNARLMLKDQAAIYGVSSQKMVLDELQKLGLQNLDVILPDIRMIGGDLSLDQLRELFSIADYYVSPYRAEGFNLPVIEAIACGTPAIVTAGGATDDFCHAGNALFIPARLHERESLAGKDQATYLEPDETALMATLERCLLTPPFDDRQRRHSAHAMATQFEWSAIARLLKQLILSGGRP